MARRRDDIDEITALDHADAEGHFPVDIAEALNLGNELRHDTDRTSPDALGDAGMCRPSVSVKLVPQEGMSPGHELVGFSRLRYQDVAVRFCFFLDQGFCGGAPDLFVRDEHESHGQAEALFSFYDF